MKSIIKRIIPWVICLLTIVISLIIIVQFNNTIYELKNERQQMFGKLNELMKTDENLFKNYENSGIKLDLNNLYTNNDYKNVKLSDLVKNGIVVFRFEDSDCMDCVYSALPLIDSLDIKLGKGKVIIISTFGNKEAMLAFAEANNIKVPVLLDNGSLNKLPIEVDNKSPYFFLLDKEGNMKNFFLPDKYFPVLTKKYFDVMFKCLYEK
jgi:peroxiredoxin